MFLFGFIWNSFSLQVVFLLRYRILCFMITWYCVESVDTRRMKKITFGHCQILNGLFKALRRTVNVKDQMHAKKYRTHFSQTSHFFSFLLVPLAFNGLFAFKLST